VINSRVSGVLREVAVEEGVSANGQMKILFVKGIWEIRL
jgi:hypothetical protein